MTGHLSEEQIALYKGRRLAPEELLWVDDHISECTDCRLRIVPPTVLRAALQNNLASDQAYPNSKKEHLEYEQLEAYVDGIIPKADEATVGAHLETCSRCSEELRDLNSFKTELTSSKEPAHEKWWSRFVARWFIDRRLTFALAASVVVVLAVVVGLRLIGPSNRGPSNETANTHPGGGMGTNPPLPGIKELTRQEQAAVEEAVASEKIKLPEALQELKPARVSEQLLGQAEESLQFKVLTPVGEVVAEDHPIFLWQPLAKAKSYSVSVFDARLNPVLSSPRLQGTEWKAARALNRGQVYLWQVTAQLSGGESVSAPSPPNPEAKFRILDQKTADEIARFQRAHSESHITLGILYAQAGVLEMAKEEWKLIPDGDSNYRLAQKLLESVQEIQSPRDPD